jgi:rare lipoprotein A
MAWPKPQVETPSSQDWRANSRTGKNQGQLGTNNSGNNLTVCCADWHVRSRRHSPVLVSGHDDAGGTIGEFTGLKAITGTTFAASLVIIAATPAMAGAPRGHCAAPVVVWEKAPSCSRGIASWYGRELRGHRTASGERFNPKELTAAHPTLPFQTRLKVTNPRNGRTVTVRVNDRGPGNGRAIDLSEAAARELGIHDRGFALVEMQVTQGG